MAENVPREQKVAAGFVTRVDAAQGIVEAVVSVFGVIDDGGDVIDYGAYAESIAEGLDRVRVLDSHRSERLRDVIGVPVSAREVPRAGLPPEVLARYPDATGGLLTVTRYLLDTPEGDGAFKRIAAGAIHEYSIGFDPVQIAFREVKGKDGKVIRARVLKQIRLWEWSPVIWGMNPATATVMVKGGIPLTPNRTDAIYGVPTAQPAAIEVELAMVLLMAEEVDRALREIKAGRG